MTESLLLALSWGLLTAISPCPLTTNIAAISFLGREAESPSRTAWAGLAYTLGRVVTLIEPLILVMMGIVVAGLLLAVYYPLLTIVTRIA